MFGEGGPSFRELMQQALSSTVAGYDQLAPKFDRTPFRTPDPVIEATLAGVGQVDDALDLCCGTGAGLRRLLGHTQRRLVGVDASSGMLDVARADLGPAMTAERPAIELVHADVFETTYAEAFDLVTCFGAFGHIPR